MNLREAALRLLGEWEADGKYINLVISSHILDGFSREERGILTSLLYTTVENKIRYDYYISSISKRSTDDISPVVLNILRLGMCQIADIDAVPSFAAVNESVKLARASERAFVNAVLRSAVRAYEGDGLPLPPYEKNPARHYSVKYSLPLWIVKKFISEFGETDACRLFSEFNKIPPTDITVNTMKISPEKLLVELKERHIDAKMSEISPMSLQIHTRCPVTELYGYDEGLFFVQDEASALAVQVLAPSAGETLIDVCAAPGGKTLAASVLMSDGGNIHSFDIRESKLSLIKSSAERLGVTSVTVAPCDAKVPKKELLGKADKIICDVPCSGLGVISKKSDLRYRSREGIDELPKLQLEILTASADYLKLGGELVYSTCTVLREENEGVVRSFLDTHDNFVLKAFEIGAVKSTNGLLTLLPHVHGTDGFFIAKIEKIREK